MGWPLRTIVDHPDELAEAFLEQYRRPLPYFEVLSIEAIEDIAWRLSALIGAEPPTIHIGRVLDVAWERMPGRVNTDRGRFRGSTEPLATAVPRFSLASRADVLVIEHAQDPVAIRLSLRHAMEFEDVFWCDERWLIDPDLRWMLAGMHDWPAYAWVFSNGL